MLPKTINKHHTWIYFAVSLILIGIHAFLSFHTEKITHNRYSWLSRSWGLNHIRFYDTTVIVSFYSSLILACIPFINHKLLYYLSKLEKRVMPLRKIRYILFIVVGLLASFLFYYFRNKYFLLGDYTLRVAQTMKQDFLATEYLTMKILYYLATFLSRFHISPTETFVLVSCAAGGFFVTLFAFISNQLGKTRLQKFLLFVGGISSGMLLIFCGYTDIYALPVAFTSLYLYMSIRYISNKRYLWIALACLALAIGSHLLCVAFAPALFIAWYSHNSHRLPFIARMTNKKRLIILFSLTLLAVIIAYKLKTGFILPVKAVPRQPNYMTLLSLKHLWEFLNGQLLACGISILVIPLLLYKVIKLKLSLSTEIYFLLAASGSMLLIVFLANLHRGSGDWDISSLTAITVTLLTMMLIFRLMESGVHFASYLLIAVIIYNSLHMCLWIHINSGKRSLAKVENMLINDPGTYYISKLPGILQLVYIYQENKLIADAERIALQACDLLPVTDIRAPILYADMLVKEKREEEAHIFYEELMKKNEFVPHAYNFLLYIYDTKGQQEKIIPLIVKFYNAYKLQPNTFIVYSKPDFCLNLIEYLYNYYKAKTPTADLREMEAIMNQLRQLAAKQK